MAFAILQFIGGVILSIGWLPQISRIVRTKSVRDLSLRSYLIMLLGIALMEAYAVHLVAGGAGVAFLVTNSMSLLVVLTVIVLIVRYSRR